MSWWIIAAICAFFVKGLCGFANTLVFTSILSFGNNNINISPVELLLGYPTNLILAVKERKSIKWSICLPLAALVILGSIPGALFLKTADTGIIKIFFGAIIIFIGLEMLLREFKPGKMKESKLLLGVIGLLSGVLCGLYGVGALLGVYLSRVTEDSKAFKANICFVFFVENTFRVFLYSLWGIINSAVLKNALILLPFVLAGLFLGMLCGKKINERYIKIIVIVLLILSGATLLFTNI